MVQKSKDRCTQIGPPFLASPAAFCFSPLLIRTTRQNLLQSVLIIAVVCSINSHQHWMSEHSTTAPGRNPALVSCESLVTTFSLTDQHRPSLVCLLFKDTVLDTHHWFINTEHKAQAAEVTLISHRGLLREVLIFRAMRWHFYSALKDPFFISKIVKENPTKRRSPWRGPWFPV